MLITIKTLNRSIHVKTVASWLARVDPGWTDGSRRDMVAIPVKPSLEVPHSSQVAEH